MPDIHHSAAKGYSGAAETYVAGRPDYPAEVHDWLTDSLGLGPDQRVLDLGSGTGKFLPALEATGATVTALEPVAQMRAQIAARFPKVAALAGSAEAIPLPDASLDVVVCAQAFHWFANAQAVAEITRVLAPGGRLGLIWNVRDTREPWVAALSEITDSYEDDTPRHRSGLWRQVIPTPALVATDKRQAVNHHIGAVEQVVVDRTLSTSFIAALPPERKAEAVARVRDLIAATPALSSGGPVAFPYLTEMFTFRKG